MKILTVGVQNKGESISTSPKIYVGKLCLTLKADCSKWMEYSIAQPLGVAAITWYSKYTSV